MLDKIQNYLKQKNVNGLFLPMVSDPSTGKGSVSLTLVVISATMVILSLVGSITQKVKGIDVNNAMEFFIITSSLYFGRKYQKGQGISAPESKEEPKL